MPTEAPIFTAWLDDFFTEYYRHRPVNATFIGRHEYDAQLPDLSENGAGDCVAGMDDLLSRLRSLPPEPLTPSEHVDRSLAEGFLRIQQWEYASQHFHRGNPSLYTGEAVFGVIGLFLTDYAPVRERADAAVERMNAIPQLLAQAQDNIRQAPRAWTARALDECEGALALFGDGIDMLLQDTSIDGGQLRAAADRAGSAFAEFRDFLQDELLLRATDGYACGEEAFDLMLRQGHFLDVSTADVVAYAEDALAEADAYLQAHARDFGATSVESALALLADRHPAADAYYARYTELWHACRQTAIDAGLVTWPDFPIEYVPRPKWTRAAAPHLYFLFYRSPAAYNRPPVHKYLVAPLDENATPDEQEAFLRSNNDSVIKLNHVVHHGSIGHHVQNWHAFRAQSRIGRIAAVDCASRIAMFCGGTMAEGWACYATGLMDEVAFLTPLESYAEVQSRRRMAARAVVDAKLHVGEFSLDEAARFYEQAAAMSPAAAHGEAVKNSMFPGAAMMYLFGMDYVSQLLREIAEQQGDAFDLTQFHDQFLSYGSIPVSLIGAEMRRHATQGS